MADTITIDVSSDRDSHIKQLTADNGNIVVTEAGISRQLDGNGITIFRIVAFLHGINGNHASVRVPAKTVDR